MANEIDRLLVQEIRRGDAGAWERLIDRYEGRLLAFVERKLRDRAAAEDVVQDTFVGFLNSLPNYDDRRELQTYLFTIASYKVTDVLRRRGRRVPLSSDGPEQLTHTADTGQPAASSIARNREQLHLEEAALTRCLGGLIRSWQEKGEFHKVKVMELLFVTGMANCDAARLLKIGEQQVANIRFAALRKLGELIRAAGLSPEVFPGLRDN
jgi:RNA polymerase sigma-70 factor (ECF subfamily)